jgi:hypothetical protein
MATKAEDARGFDSYVAWSRRHYRYDLYVNVEKERAWRKKEAERVGVGFTLPTSVVPNVPRIRQASAVEIAA